MRKNLSFSEKEGTSQGILPRVGKVLILPTLYSLPLPNSLQMNKESHVLIPVHLLIFRIEKLTLNFSRDSLDLCILRYLIEIFYISTVFFVQREGADNATVLYPDQTTLGIWGQVLGSML